MNIVEESHNRLKEMLFAERGTGIKVSTTPDIDGIHDCDRYLSILEDYDIEFRVRHNTAVTAIIEVLHTVETGIMCELLRIVKTEADLLNILAKVEQHGQRELYEEIAENLCLM